MSIGYPEILMNSVVVILALVIFIISVYLLIFKKGKLNKNLKLLLGILIIITTFILGAFLLAKVSSRNMSNLENGNKSSEEREASVKHQIKFSTGEIYQFIDLNIKRVIDDNTPEKLETIFKGTEDIEKMNKVIEILSTLEVADAGETLESIPDKNSLIIDFESGKDNFSITMYDSKPYIVTGRYHYTLSENIDGKIDYKALISNTNLIKEILYIIK